MSIRRAARRRSVGIPVPLLNDERLSFKAKGLASFLLAKPDAWRIDARALARVGPDGRDAVLSGLAELRTHGYLVTRRGQGDNGRWWTESVLYESPDDALDVTAADDPQPVEEPGDDDDTEVGFPGSGAPDPGAPDPLSLPERAVEPPTPTGSADGDPPSVHNGQHRSCRECGTNPRGRKPPDPELVRAEAQRRQHAANVADLHEKLTDPANLPPDEGAVRARAARAALRPDPPAEDEARSA